MIEQKLDMQTPRRTKMIKLSALLIYCVLSSALIGFAALWFSPLDSKVVAILVLATLPVFIHFTWRQQTTRRHSSQQNVENDYYQIGTANLVVASRELTFNGTPADVQPKVFDLLVFLVTNRHRVISKDELLDTVWPNMVVAESSLTQSIKRLRDAFRSNGFTADIIRTVPRKGYQFDHHVNEVKAATKIDNIPFTTNRYPTIVSSVVAVLLAIMIWHIEQPKSFNTNKGGSVQSIVVLPFENLSADAEFNYFANGLTQTITYTLTQADDLRVIAYDSAQQVEQANNSATSIGKTLAVSHVMTGSVQKQQEAVRIRVALIDVATGVQIWSRQFDKALSNVFAIHDEIASQIVEQNRFSPTGLDSKEDNAVKDKSRAYLLTLQANEQSAIGTKSARVEAERVYKQALHISPNYGPALVGLSNVLRTRTTLGELPRETGFNDAMKFALKATQLDPNNVEAFIQIAEIQHRHFWDFSQAEQSFKHATALRPSYAPGQVAYGRFLSKAGRYKQALQQARTAKALDPLSASASSSLIIRLIRANQLAEARDALDAMQHSHAHDPNLPWLETNWHIRNGNYQQALQWVAQEELPYLQLSLSAIALHHLGRTGQAQKALDELIRNDAEGAAFQIAEVFAQWGQKDSAFSWLQQAFEQGDPGIIELYSSVNLFNLYDDPRFFTLAKQIGLPEIAATSLHP